MSFLGVKKQRGFAVWWRKIFFSALMAVSGLITLLPAAPVVAESPAQDVLRPGVPQLFGDDFEDGSRSLELERLDVHVRLHGFLAETTLEMTFFNHEYRELVGDFQLELPEGATVTGHGLDVDGVIDMSNVSCRIVIPSAHGILGRPLGLF